MNFRIGSVLLLALLGMACAKSVANPPVSEAKPEAEDETGLKPVKFPQVQACFEAHVKPVFSKGEAYRDYVVSLKTTTLPLDLRVGPIKDMKADALRLCLLAAVGQIQPKSILFATGIRLYPNRSPTAIPMIQGALTPLQVREGIMENEFGRCILPEHYDVRMHGAAILKGTIINGKLQDIEFYGSTFGYTDYASCIEAKLAELEFHPTPEPSVLAFPFSMRISDL